MTQTTDTRRMQIVISDMSPLQLDVQVDEPEDGVVPRVHVRPLGAERGPSESRYLLSFSADEAEQLGGALLDAAARLRART